MIPANTPKYNKGVTLIELLIVVSLFGILTSIYLIIINPRMTQNKAGDSVRVANLNKLVAGINGFFAAEGYYPTDSDSDGEIIDEPGVSAYIEQWPTEPVGSIYVYFRDANNYGVRIANSAGGCYKYHSSWQTPSMCSICGNDSNCN